MGSINVFNSAKLESPVQENFENNIDVNLTLRDIVMFGLSEVVPNTVLEYFLQKFQFVQLKAKQKNREELSQRHSKINLLITKFSWC